MCGLFGIASHTTGEFDIREPLALLAHRGPDAAGTLYWRRGGEPVVDPQRAVPADVVLGHRRLSIIDLSDAASQPMWFSKRRWWIVFNGELYNYVELREDLKREGCSFRTSSDTEVAVAAIATWGHEAALTRFVGMFAFALLDIQNRTLLLARDPFGIKPLYVCSWSGRLAFSSEVAPLLKLPGVDTALDAQAVYEYLRFGLTDHGSGTLLQGVRQVPSASWTVIPLDGTPAPKDLRYVRYWRPSVSARRDITFPLAVRRVREEFLKSIMLHLRSDVPIGMALSGGIDSSAVVCAARYLNPAQELQVFTYVADDRRLSEESWADRIAAAAKARHHKVTFSASDLATDLDRLIQSQGEPFGSTSIYAQWRVFEAARRQGVKVMLDGQGADELLGGYAFYQGARIATLLTRRSFGQAFGLLRAQTRWGRSPLTALMNAASHLLPHGVLPLFRRLAGREDDPIYLSSDWFREQGVRLEYPYGVDRGGNTLIRCLIRDLTGSGIPHLLRYEDRNSMAHSIESRVPFLTTDLVDLVLSLPEEYIVGQNGSSKRVFREAMRGIVPDAVLDRKDKIGFWTPESKILRVRTDLVADSIRAADRIPCLSPAGTRSWIERILSGRRRYSPSVWRIVNFVRWRDRMATSAGARV